jgi:hypothetical protein
VEVIDFVKLETYQLCSKKGLKENLLSKLKRNVLGSEKQNCREVLVDDL